MIAKFSTAEDLMAHYATIRARLRGPTPKTVAYVNTSSVHVPEMVQDLEPVFVATPTAPLINLPAEPVSPDFIRINFDEVVALVCQHLKYDRRQIFAERRTHKLCFDRQLLWALAHKHCLHMSLPQIGRASGNRDHTTVLHGRRKGVNHPEYGVLSQSLQDLYEEKLRVNAELMKPKESVEAC